MEKEEKEEANGREAGKRRKGGRMGARGRIEKKTYIGWRKAEIHACHGTEQTRASRAYDGASAHLRLEDKHRHLYKLVDTPGKKYRV